MTELSAALDVTGLWVITTDLGRVYRFSWSLAADGEAFSGELLDHPGVGSTVYGKCQADGQIHWTVDRLIFFQGVIDPGCIAIQGGFWQASQTSRTAFVASRVKPGIEKEEAEKLAQSKAAFLVPGSSRDRMKSLRDLLCVLPFAAPHAAVVARCLGDEDAATRCCAVETLRLIGRSAVAQAQSVVEVLDDIDDGVRFCALAALGAMGEAAESERNHAVASLRDRSRHVRLRALQLLAEPSTSTFAAPAPAYVRRSREALAEYGEASVEDTRFAAVFGLPVEDTGPHKRAWMALIGPILDECLADGDPIVRCGGLSVLKVSVQILRDSAEKYIDSVTALLVNPDPAVQELALCALQAMGPAASAKLGFHFVD